MTNAEKNAMMAALRTEGYYFDEDKLYVTERFHKAASQFGSVQYKKIMDMLSYYPNASVEVVSIGSSKATKEINVMSYETMIRYICLLPEKEKYLKEMKRMKLLSHSKKSPYKFMRKWFADTFPDYIEKRMYDETGKTILKKGTGENKDADKNAVAETEHATADNEKVA